MIKMISVLNHTKKYWNHHTFKISFTQNFGSKISSTQIRNKSRCYFLAGWHLILEQVSVMNWNSAGRKFNFRHQYGHLVQMNSFKAIQEIWSTTGLSIEFKYIFTLHFFRGSGVVMVTYIARESSATLEENLHFFQNSEITAWWYKAVLTGSEQSKWNMSWTLVHEEFFSLETFIIIQIL